MRYLLLTGLILIASILCAANVDPADWKWQYPHSLPHARTPAEQQASDRVFFPTDPPNPPVRQIAEFEPMYGVLIRYPLGIPFSLVAELAEDDILVTIVSSEYNRQQAMESYDDHDVNLDHCRFLIAPTDSFWARDYGPFFVFDPSDSMRVVNFQYNRPRPNDDDIPIAYAAFDTLGLFGMNVKQTGGNYMCDGMGVAVSTDLVLEENGSLSQSEIEDLHEEYLGIETFHIVDDPLGEYIKHVDCWGKFLDVDKVLVGRVASSDPRYQDFEDTAQYFAQQNSSYGTPYQVFRVYTPATSSPYTPYTNSLILNKKVLVPMTGNPWDDEAIVSYQEAMPGYEIIGVPYSSWYNTDALHCRVHEIPDKHMLYVRHIPVDSQQDIFTEVRIEATIQPYSGAELIADSLLVYYRTDGGGFSTAQLQFLSNDTYYATISATEVESTVEYYLYAVDEAGKRRFLPTAGAMDPFGYRTELLYLEPPRDLSIEVVADSVRIGWEVVPGATSYRVQQSDDEAVWTDLTETTRTSIRIAVVDRVRFYRVVANAR